MGEELVFFSFLYIKLFELCANVAFYNRSAELTTKLICSNSHFGAAALSAPMMLLCCSLTSASFTPRNPSSLSVDRLNSKIHTICRASLRPHPVACPRNDLWRKTVDRGYTVPLDFFWSVFSHLYPVPCLLNLPCCRFWETLLVATVCSFYFLCQAWRTWAYFLAFVNVHAVIQVPPDGVVGSRRCRCHPFAVCTVDVTECFSRQTVSALTSGLLCSSAKLTPSWSHVAKNFGLLAGCWHISCHCHPQMSPSPLCIYLPASCFSVKSVPHVPKKGWWMPTFFPWPWYKSFWISFHPFMYHVIELLLLSDQSLHRIVVLVY